MSAHSAAQRGGWLSALVAQVSDYVFEEVEEPGEPQPQELEPHPVVAVVAAAPRSGATTLARMLAAEMAIREGGAAVVIGTSARRRTCPPSRAALRLATALTGVGHAHPVGRLCVMTPGAETAVAPVRDAARYLAPVVLDLPADGSAAGIATIAERVVVVAAGSSEPALLDAVAAVVGGNPITVVNRVTDLGVWADRVDLVIPESRLGVRAAALGTRSLGSLGSAVTALADALEVAR